MFSCKPRGCGGVVSRTSQRLTTSSFSTYKNQHIFIYNQAENVHIHQGTKYRKTQHYSQIFLQPLNELIFDVPPTPSKLPFFYKNLSALY